MKHIIHVISSLNVGGAELMLKRLIENDKINTHSVITLLNGGVLKNEFEATGVRVISLCINRHLDIPFSIFKLRKIIKGLNPDVVQTWMYHSDFLGGIAARTLGIDKVVWNVRNTDLKARGKINFAFRKICGFFSRVIPDEIVYVSESARVSHEKEGFDSSKSVVIYNGFDTEKYKFSKRLRDNLRKEMNVDDKDILVFSVGRYADAKDHKSFIDVIKGLRSHNVKGVMIGREMDYNNEEITKYINCDNDLFLLMGERDNVHELLSSADIFCLHSITEGFPNVLGEAMSVGLPCITTRAGDAEHILNNHLYTCEVGNVSQMMDRILTLSRISQIDRVNIGKVNRERIISNFTLSKTITDYQKVYSR
ncbi:glycosyltransferase [Vibrio diabolicus]|uniref:glycosyltransferase n=1 Tax=Vibrio diabolicus TaxID=50719 RepID=UPI002480ED5F|nr:glycosyltransferase [Vibrio diabolicus]